MYYVIILFLIEDFYVKNALFVEDFYVFCWISEKKVLLLRHHNKRQ